MTPEYIKYLEEVKAIIYKTMGVTPNDVQGGIIISGIAAAANKHKEAELEAHFKARNEHLSKVSDGNECMN